MGTRDPRVDAYIAKAAEFARPVLEQLRAAVHAACPGVAETIKWGMPFFVQDRPLCYMAAFKRHCAFGFWKGEGLLRAADRTAMGQFGRILSPSDLPPRRTLEALLRRAARLYAGAAAPRRAVPRRPPPRVPADLRAALAVDARAKAGFDALPPSGRREFIEWLTDAKRPETRAQRLARTVSCVRAGRRFDQRSPG